MTADILYCGRWNNHMLADVIAMADGIAIGWNAFWADVFALWQMLYHWVIILI